MDALITKNLYKKVRIKSLLFSFVLVIVLASVQSNDESTCYSSCRGRMSIHSV